MKKARVYNFESREMWIADGYDELSEMKRKNTHNSDGYRWRNDDTH